MATYTGGSYYKPKGRMPSSMPRNRFTEAPTEKGYCKEIDAPWVIEIISERFDGQIFDIMTDHGSVIYGGAVRDALAGIEIVGDLDLSVSRSHISTVVSNLQKTTKWTKINEKEAKSLKKLRVEGQPISWLIGEEGTPRLRYPYSEDAPELASSGYKEDMPIHSVYHYKNVNGAVCQVIVSDRMVMDDKEAATFLARNVDIICCGVVMDKEGRVFEVLEGAYEDCKARALRHNIPRENALSFKRLLARIEKLAARGWKCEMDLKAVEKEYKLAEKAKKKRAVKERHSMEELFGEKPKKMYKPGEKKELVNIVLKVVTALNGKRPSPKIMDVLIARYSQGGMSKLERAVHEFINRGDISLKPKQRAGSWTENFEAPTEAPTKVRPYRHKPPSKPRPKKRRKSSVKVVQVAKPSKKKKKKTAAQEYFTVSGEKKVDNNF